MEIEQSDVEEDVRGLLMLVAEWDVNLSATPLGPEALETCLGDLVESQSELSLALKELRSSQVEMVGELTEMAKAAGRRADALCRAARLD